MNKKNIIWLLVAVWTLVSCGTVKNASCRFGAVFTNARTAAEI